MISMEYSSKCIKANIGIIQDHDIKPLKSSLKKQTGRPNYFKIDLRQTI